MPGPCSNGTILAMARRVLIVDDSAGFRAQARAAGGCGLRRRGRGDDGSSGVRMAGELSPQVVLLDVQSVVEEGGGPLRRGDFRQESPPRISTTSRVANVASSRCLAGESNADSSSIAQLHRRATGATENIRADRCRGGSPRLVTWCGVSARRVEYRGESDRAQLAPTRLGSPGI
jgi:hypothetical protein